MQINKRSYFVHTVTSMSWGPDELLAACSSASGAGEIIVNVVGGLAGDCSCVAIETPVIGVIVIVIGITISNSKHWTLPS